MNQATRIGTNRTGAQMSPLATPDMAREAEQSAVPHTSFATGRSDGTGLAGMRAAYIAEAEPLGTVPPPGTLKGVITSGVQRLVGNNPEVLIDKLGERLAFERTGVRLYEAFMAKCRDQRGAATRIAFSDLERIRSAEARHFHLLAQAIESLGADPTAQTPGADANGVMSAGIIQLLTDPRSTIAQGLEALMTIELIDNASWDLLIKLTTRAGQTELARRFLDARTEEAEHLAMVNRWLELEVLAQAR